MSDFRTCPVASDTARHLADYGRRADLQERAAKEVTPLDAMPKGYAEHPLPAAAERAVFAAMTTDKAGAWLIAELSIAFAAACRAEADRSGRSYRAVREEYQLPYPYPEEVVSDGRWGFDAPLADLFARALCGHTTTEGGAPLAPALAKALAAQLAAEVDNRAVALEGGVR